MATVEKIWAAKELIDGSDIFKLVADSCTSPAETPEEEALQRVIAAGELCRGWRDWQFRQPRTADAMTAAPGTVLVYGRLYRGQSCFENCPEGEVLIDLYRLADQDYLDSLFQTELGHDFLRDLCTVI